MTRADLSQRLAALRSGQRWWPAEAGMRGLGLMLLGEFWRLTLVARSMAVTPAPHPAGAADLAVCTAIVFLLCSGLTLVLAGPGLFLDVPLPPHFTRPADFKP